MEKNIEILIQRYPELKPLAGKIEEAFNILKKSFDMNGKILVAGNGGSAADADHIVGELMKGFVLPRPLPEEEKKKLAANGDNGYLAEKLQGSLPAISLMGHNALISAFSNDQAPDLFVAQQVYGYGNENDVFLGITTSGNSNNIVEAAIVARSRGMKVIALTGKTGGKMKKLADVAIQVPAAETYQVQERHLPIYHTLCLMLEEAFFYE